MKYATTSGPDADALAGQARHRLSADEAAEREQALERYILDHISAEDPYLYRLYRATHTRLLRPRMASGHLQGQVLRMLTTMIQPRTVVEIGTFSGYSALSMAAGMAPDSAIYTFEVNDEQEDFTRPWLEGSPYPPHIRLIIGDVMTLLPQMDTGPIDMAFVDANKRDYSAYYRLLMPRLRPGGYLIADNTLWDGHVIDPAYAHDAQTQGVMAFNDLVARDEGAEKVILPLRDGLTIIRKKNPCV